VGVEQYRAQHFIDAIPGSGGIIQTIADRVGCAWHTAKKYIDNYATVRQVYDDELEKGTDLAEAILRTNMVLAHKKQQKGEIVDTGDARWFLTMKAKDRGYVTRVAQQVTGKDGEPVRVIFEEVDNWRGGVTIQDSESTSGPEGGL